MELRRGDAPALAGLGDHLPALHRLAAMDEDLGIVRIGGDPAVGVLDQDEIAVSLQLVTGIGDDTVLGGLDRGVLRHRDVDAVVLLAVRLAAKVGDHAALRRPAELQAAGRGGLGLGLAVGGLHGGGAVAARRCGPAVSACGARSGGLAAFFAPFEVATATFGMVSFWPTRSATYSLILLVYAISARLTL